MRTKIRSYCVRSACDAAFARREFERSRKGVVVPSYQRNVRIGNDSKFFEERSSGVIYLARLHENSRFFGFGGISVYAIGRSHQSCRRARSRLAGRRRKLLIEGARVRVGIAIDHALDAKLFFDSRGDRLGDRATRASGTFETASRIIAQETR